MTKNQTLLRALIDNAIAASDQMRKGIISETEFDELLRHQQDDVINRLAPEPTPKQHPFILTVETIRMNAKNPVKHILQCNYKPSLERDSVTGQMYLCCAQGQWLANSVICWTVKDNPNYVESE